MNLAIMVLLEITLRKDNMGVFKFIVINDKIE